MATTQLTVEVHRKWWVIPSIRVLSALCRVFRFSPNVENVATWYGLYGFDMEVNGKRIRMGCL